MAIKAECVQNEITCNTDYNFQVRLYNDADDTAYTPTSATVKFVDQTGSTILDTSAMTISSNLISKTLAASYIQEPSIYNSAIITVAGTGVNQVITFLFHVVKQIIVNTLNETHVTDRFSMLSKHKPAAGYYKKINAAFRVVKDDLLQQYGLQYSLGMVDGSQIKEITLLKTIELICQDFAAGEGATDDNYWWQLYERYSVKYTQGLQGIKLAYDGTLEENYVDRERAAMSIECYR
jgi:hypothetical protein